MDTAYSTLPTSLLGTAQAEQLHTQSFTPEEKPVCNPILFSLQVNSVHLEKSPEKYISYLHSDEIIRLATGLVPCVEAVSVLFTFLAWIKKHY